MAATFELEVATPDRLVVREQASEAQLPGKDGYVGVLPEHAPLLGEVGVGVLSYVVDGKKHSLVVGGGWMEVLGDKVRVLAVVAEKGTEIDVARAKAALERAEKRMRESGDHDIPRALAAAERARARLAIAAEYGR